MIDKDKIKEQNIQIIDTTESINPLFEYLKKNFPQVVDSDNQVSLKTIASLLGMDNSLNTQGYELTFAGKGLANALYSTPISKELRLEPSQSKVAPPPLESKCKEKIDTRNTIIRGDNLDVLKLLKSAYSDKIKMIYIDPPYNTKNDDFTYPDNFREDYKKILIETGLLSFDEDGKEIPSETLKFFKNITGARSHTGWLSFMLPRLKLARDLLREDGVIFISIDDNEQANLKLLCDEIFGEENFVGDFIRKTKSTTNDAKIGVNIQHENCLCFAKDKNNICLLGGEKDLSKYKNPDNDPNGAWVSADPSAKSGNPQTGYFAVKNPYTGKEDYPPVGMFWRFSQNTIQRHIDEGRICFKKEHKENERGFIYKRYLKDLKTTLRTFDSLEFASNEYMNQVATKEAISLEIVDVFSYPKPQTLLKRIIEVSTDKDDIVMDFFAGSGTTAQAVMELNAQDGGNREFILVQIDQEIDEGKNKTTYDFCKNELGSQMPSISDITIERVNRAGEKIKEAFKQDLTKNIQNLDIDYKVYTLSDKPSIISDGLGVLKFVSSRDGSSSADIARNLALSSGKILSLPLEEIIKDKLYFCQDSYYLVGVDDEVMDKLGSIKDFEIYIDGYSDIDLQNLLNLNVANKEQIKVIY